MATKKEILAFLKDKKSSYFASFRLTKLGLMGSFSRNQAGRNSDIDLIVEFETGTQNLSDLTEKLRKSIKRQFRREVDICREKYIKPYYKKNILRDAIFI